MPRRASRSSYNYLDARQETHILQVTNVSINAGAADFVPERPVIDLEAEHPRHFAAVRRALRSLATAAAPALAPCRANRNRFELVGVDFLCDDGGEEVEAWLVECNCPPNSAGSAADGPIERFHHELMADVLGRFVLADESTESRWVEAGGFSDDSAFSPRFGPALAWTRFGRAARGAERAAYGARPVAPPAAATAVALEARKRFGFFDAARPRRRGEFLVCVEERIVLDAPSHHTTSARVEERIVLDARRGP